MVSIILSTILVTVAEIPQIKNANAEKSPPFEEMVFCTVPWFVSFGIVIDLDSLAAARVPGAASFPSEMLQALQSRNERERGAAVESLALLATLAQSCVHFEDKSDGTMRFQEALGRLAPSYKKALIGRLSDPNSKIRHLASATVLVLEPDNQEALNAVVAGLRTMDLDFVRNVGPLRLTNQRIIACLADALRSKDGKVQRAAARAVMEIGPPAKAAIPALVELLKSKEAVEYDFVPGSLLRSQDVRILP